MMKTLNEKEWAAIPITGMFYKIVPGKGKGLNHLTKIADGVNYIGATNRNNGVMCSVADDELSNSLIQEGNCIGFIKNGDGSAGYAIYKRERFVSTSDVIYGYADWLNPNSGIFFVAAQDMIEEKYSHGYKRNQQHLRGDKVMLPVTDDGEPDYEYMSNYVKVHKEAMLAKYRDYAEKQIAEIGDYVEIPALNEKKWEPISIINLFSEFTPGKISNASAYFKTHVGNVEYIAATNKNNGCLCFFEESEELNKKVQKGNCIGFIKDGDGSAGFAIYKKERFVSTVNVIYGYADWLNSFTGLFFVAAQDKIEDKYGHGYKRNQQHLCGDKVMLPTTDSGKPDFEYMEQYAKNMMLRKYQQYLSYADGGEG